MGVPRVNNSKIKKQNDQKNKGEEFMVAASEVDVTRLLNERKFSSFNVQIVVLSFVILLLDGYDITVMAFAIPALTKAWGLTNPGVFGPVLSASLFGILVGAPLFGYIGDRYGRRTAIILSCIVFGLFTWFVIFATTLTHLFALRFLAGLGIGGVLANASAINAEFAPRRFQGTAVILAFTGAAFGGALPGPVSALLVPTHGWTMLFHIGGILPLIMAAFVAWRMPESVRYLALRDDKQDEIRRIVRLLEPGYAMNPDTRFVVQNPEVRSTSPTQLFLPGLATITILLWAIVSLVLMGYFFLISWMPTLLTRAQIPGSEAALITGALQIGGVVGCLAVSRLVDKYRVLPVVILFVLAVPVVACIGFVGVLSKPMLIALVFLAGFCVLAVQVSMAALSAMVYPTSLRASGVGWAFGIGRAGSIVGPLLGGALISAQLTAQQLYLAGAAPFALGAILSLILMGMYRRRMENLETRQ
jgi:AAHS family 4-hydroxybenzoate transporter-like MFS transporter